MIINKHQVVENKPSIKYYKEPNNIFSKSNYENLIAIINDGIFSYNFSSSISCKYSDFKGFDYVKSKKATFPEYKKYPLLIDINKILIPKVLTILNSNKKNDSFKDIDEDVEVSKELCLLLLSQLVSFYYTKTEDDRFKFKNLNSDFLRKTFPKKSDLYLKIIDVLTCLGLIECDNNNIIKKKSFGYRIKPSILKKGLDIYELKTKYAYKCLNRKNEQLLKSDNVIIKNLIEFYKDLTFPSIEEVWQRGVEMAKNKTKIKGKLFVNRGKHPKSYYKNKKNKVFLDDSIKKYEFNILKKGGLKIPKSGGENCGNRIYDSLNLLPKWIRGMIKYKGEFLEEIDYKCLHPNIVQFLYGGKQEFITHEKIAEQTNLPIQKVKKLHLSLFNTSNEKMCYNSLFYSYFLLDFDMMNKLTSDKKYNDLPLEERYKITSRKMFAKEVEILTEVVKKLNEEGIYVMYVFDALYCSPHDKMRVSELMNEVVLKAGVKTTVS